MFSGNSAGLLVSTMTQACPSSTSEMMRGLGRFHFFSIESASVFGSPNKTASASPPFTSFMYHAQRMGEPVESVSGDLWPKTRVLMSLSCHLNEVDLRAL